MTLPVESCPHRKIDPFILHSQRHCCWWLQGISNHDDVIKWKHFPRYWPFVRGIHRSPVNSPHKGQWRGALMFSLIRVWINDWVNNHEAGDLRRHRGHYDVNLMPSIDQVILEYSYLSTRRFDWPFIRRSRISYIDGLGQDCSISSALTLQSCTKPSKMDPNLTIILPADILATEDVRSSASSGSSIKLGMFSSNVHFVFTNEMILSTMADTRSHQISRYFACKYIEAEIKGPTAFSNASP